MANNGLFLTATALKFANYNKKVEYPKLVQQYSYRGFLFATAGLSRRESPLTSFGCVAEKIDRISLIGNK